MELVMAARVSPSLYRLREVFCIWDNPHNRYGLIPFTNFVPFDETGTAEVHTVTGSIITTVHLVVKHPGVLQ
jgi:hypothetical protein